MSGRAAAPGTARGVRCAFDGNAASSSRPLPLLPSLSSCRPRVRRQLLPSCREAAASGAAAAAAAAAGDSSSDDDSTRGGGGGSGGGAGGRRRRQRAGRPDGSGDSGSSSASGDPMWLRTAALAAGAYLALGLAQPWRLLQRGAEPVDTSGWAVAVVIPTLNEASTIEATLRDVRGRLSPPPAEVIVVDGGSTDGTEAIARRSGLATRVLRTKRKGRARQMNAGAAAASSPLLVFLHADTRPPRGVVAAARRVLRDPRAVLGGFWPVIEGCPLLSANNFLSTYYGPALLRPRAFLAGMRVLFGDQTLFCRAADFARVGGFDARLRIMEDADLCVRLHEAGFSGGGRGRVVHVLDAGPSVTSGRRVGRWGGLYATWVHLRVSLAWYATRGADGAYERLERLYERLYTDDR